MYFNKDVGKMFPTFYTQVVDERFKRDTTLKIEKNIYIYKSRQE
jgi:hypothetical protein